MNKTLPMRYGKRRCTACGKPVTRNALGRTAHEKGFICFRDSLWRDVLHEPGLGTVLFQATLNEKYEERAVKMVVSLARNAPARLKKGG